MEFLVRNGLDNSTQWIAAATAPLAVIKAEAARTGTPEKALKAGHDDRSEIDTWCGESSILGRRQWVTR